MLREIRKKMVILKNHMPFTAELKSYLRQIEQEEWLNSSMELEGSLLAKGQIQAIFAGEVCADVSIDEHIMVRRTGDLVPALWRFFSMKREPELNLVREIAGVIYGGIPEYRKKTVMISELNYVPPHPAQIPEKMDELAAFFIKADEAEPQTEECFLSAAAIHDMIAEIVPYGERDRLLARTAAAYYLITRGYPLVTFCMREQDYNMMTEKYLKTGNHGECAEELEKAVLKRLKLMTQLTRY